MKNATLKDCCVVDVSGLYRAFITVQTERGADGEPEETVIGYKLAEGERLIDAQPPLMKNHAGGAGFVKPRWDEDAAAWIEGATAEEMDAWEMEHPDPVSLEEKRAAKLAELSAACNASIDAGTSVTMPDGSEADFTYSTADQANVSEMFLACMMGATSYPYHANDENCKIYTAEEIMAIYSTLSMYKTGQITYHNQLKQYVKSLTSQAEVGAVVYGQPLTGDYLTTYNDLMATATMQMQELISKIGDRTGTTS